MSKVIVVIGAGLSSLTCVYNLLKSLKLINTTIIILESESRVGGRIYSQEGIYIY